MNQEWFVKVRLIATGWVVVSKRGERVIEYAYSAWTQVVARIEEELGVPEGERSTRKGSGL
jgi:hypothetical protein